MTAVTAVSPRYWNYEADSDTIIIISISVIFQTHGGENKYLLKNDLITLYIVSLYTLGQI